MKHDEIIATLREARIETPAFFLVSSVLAVNARRARLLLPAGRCRLLFALKSFSLLRGCEYIARDVDGFAASSLFEARLAARVRLPGQSIHLTSPGLRPDELGELTGLVDYLAYNSLGRWRRVRKHLAGTPSPGLRVNPRLSFVADSRYDPCRVDSKLGLPLEALSAVLREHPKVLNGIEGLHFHSNCDSRDFAQLKRTVEKLSRTLAPLLGRIRWGNMGGGYLFDAPWRPQLLAEMENLLAGSGIERIFMEPGAGLVRDAGVMVSRVLDLFTSGGRRVAVLDTSVNHMPEVFEYQWRPPVAAAARMASMPTCWPAPPAWPATCSASTASTPRWRSGNGSCFPTWVPIVWSRPTCSTESACRPSTCCTKTASRNSSGGTDSTIT